MYTLYNEEEEELSIRSMCGSRNDGGPCNGRCRGFKGRFDDVGA